VLLKRQANLLVLADAAAAFKALVEAVRLAEDELAAEEAG
jgi:hypothetical protein